MEQETIKIKNLKVNPGNPRTIKDQKFKKLVESVRSFPEMLYKRPLVCVTDPEDGKLMPLGGNQRLQAIKELNYKEIPSGWVMIADEWTEEQRSQFMIKDNVSSGDWDWDSLANTFDFEVLEDWGFDVPGMSTEKEDPYTSKIVAPDYKPTGEKPLISELFNKEKTDGLVLEIENSKVPKEVKEFLKISAQRHIVFDYGKIAEFYAQTDKDTQELMEKSALVIIDFDKAIENGYIELSKKITDLYEADYE